MQMYLNADFDVAKDRKNYMYLKVVVNQISCFLDPTGADLESLRAVFNEKEKELSLVGCISNL